MPSLLKPPAGLSAKSTRPQAPREHGLRPETVLLVNVGPLMPPAQGSGLIHAKFWIEGSQALDWLESILRIAVGVQTSVMGGVVLEGVAFKP